MGPWELLKQRQMVITQNECRDGQPGLTNSESNKLTPTEQDQVRASSFSIALPIVEAVTKAMESFGLPGFVYQSSTSSLDVRPGKGENGILGAKWIGLTIRLSQEQEHHLTTFI